MPQRAIRFEGVTFAYPGTTTPVFDRLDLEVPARSSLAVVGANGAGKTTLVKLLARLYEPSAGRITVDGVDVRDLDLGSWRPGCPSSSRTSCATSSPLATTWAWGGGCGCTTRTASGPPSSGRGAAS